MSVFSTYSTCKCLDVCHNFLGNSKRRSKEDTVEIEKIVQKLKNYIVLLWPVCHFRSLWCSQLVSVSIEEGNKFKETLKKNWCTKGYQVQNKYEFEHNFNQSGLFSIALFASSESSFLNRSITDEMFKNWMIEDVKHSSFLHWKLHNSKVGVSLTE